MTYRFANLADLSDAPRLWNSIVAASPEAWIWSTHSTYLFRLSYMKAKSVLAADRSFVLFDGERPCGLAPILLTRDRETNELTSAYDDAPLPWPMIVPGIGDAREIEKIIFDEVERRSLDEGAGRLLLMLAPPSTDAAFADKFSRIVRERHLIDSSYTSHCMELSGGTLSTVRERYRRYVRKLQTQYEMQIIGAADVTASLAAKYMQLHVKDAGGVFRPLLTYECQIDQIRAGEAFFVSARKRSEDRVAGMLLIQVFKGAAYDSSVAVDPDFEDEGVSYLLKWRAIEHLISAGVRHYELGRAAIAPTFLWQPSAKNYGISFFKDGWSRGQLKPVWVAEKFYSKKALASFFERKKSDLINYFSLPEFA